MSSSWVANVSKDRVSTTTLGNLFHCLTTLFMKTIIPFHWVRISLAASYFSSFHSTSPRIFCLCLLCNHPLPNGRQQLNLPLAFSSPAHTSTAPSPLFMYHMHHPPDFVWIRSTLVLDGFSCSDVLKTVHRVIEYSGFKNGKKRVVISSHDLLLHICKYTQLTKRIFKQEILRHITHKKSDTGDTGSDRGDTE